MLPADYQTKLANAIRLGEALDKAVRANDAAGADEQLAALDQSCKQCHAVHRDR